jgi:hypothetical protein
MLEKAIILASAATMLGIGYSRLAFVAMAKGGEDSAEIAERIGQYDCHSSRVRGWDSSRILLWNYRQHRVFATARGTVKSASRGPPGAPLLGLGTYAGASAGSLPGWPQLRSKTEGRLQTNDAVRRLRIVRTTGQCV